MVSLVSNLLDVLKQEQRLYEKQKQIDLLSTELNKLRQQNDKMREGMRRCVSCDYRQDVLKGESEEESIN